MSHRHRTETVHKSKRKLDDVRSDINVTPLVDVCLVLLIIFLVVAEKLTRGKEVPLPKTRYHCGQKDQPPCPRDTGEELIISVTKDGARSTVWYDRDAMKSLDEFKKRLEDELHRKQKPMYFKADADLKYGDVYPVLMAMHDSGAQQIMMGTQEMKEK